MKPTNMLQFQLSIPEPCHENWQSMTPTEQGRFCNACAKEVVDFSMMTDAEVLGYFSNYKNEKICGRAIPSQLGRTITMPKEPVKRRFWYWNYITMIFLFFGKTNKINAQAKRVTVAAKKVAGNAGNTITNNNPDTRIRMGGVSSITISKEPLYVIDNKIASKPDVDKIDLNNIEDVTVLQAAQGSAIYGVAGANGVIVITTKKPVIKVESIVKGTIKDESGNPIPFPSIMIKNTRTGVNADASGKFFITLPNPNVTIVITAVGYNSKEIKLDGAVTEQTFVLEKSANMMLGEIIIVTPPRKKRGCPSSSAVALKANIKQPVIATNITEAKIYPNPVSRGQSFVLSLKLNQTGTYYLQIIDAEGKTVLQKQFTAVNKIVKESINTSSQWSSGMYHLKIVSADNKLISTNSFMVE